MREAHRDYKERGKQRGSCLTGMKMSEPRTSVKEMARETGCQGMLQKTNVRDD